MATSKITTKTQATNVASGVNLLITQPEGGTESLRRLPAGLLGELYGEGIKAASTNATAYNKLPEPSAEYDGDYAKLNGHEDIVYICKQVDGIYQWFTLHDSEQPISKNLVNPENLTRVYPQSTGTCTTSTAQCSYWLRCKKHTWYTISKSNVTYRFIIGGCNNVNNTAPCEILGSNNSGTSITVYSGEWTRLIIMCCNGANPTMPTWVQCEVGMSATPYVAYREVSHDDAYAEKSDGSVVRVTRAAPRYKNILNTKNTTRAYPTNPDSETGETHITTSSEELSYYVEVTPNSWYTISKARETNYTTTNESGTESDNRRFRIAGCNSLTANSPCELFYSNTTTGGTIGERIVTVNSGNWRYLVIHCRTSSIEMPDWVQCEYGKKATAYVAYGTDTTDDAYALKSDGGLRRLDDEIPRYKNLLDMGNLTDCFLQTENAYVLSRSTGNYYSYWCDVPQYTDITVTKSQVTARFWISGCNKVGQSEEAEVLAYDNNATQLTFNTGKWTKLVIMCSNSTDRTMPTWIQAEVGRKFTTRANYGVTDHESAYAMKSDGGIQKINNEFYTLISTGTDTSSTTVIEMAIPDFAEYSDIMFHFFCTNTSNLQTNFGVLIDDEQQKNMTYLTSDLVAKNDCAHIIGHIYPVKASTNKVQTSDAVLRYDGYYGIATNARTGGWDLNKTFDSVELKSLINNSTKQSMDNPYYIGFIAGEPISIIKWEIWGKK